MRAGVQLEAVQSQMRLAAKEFRRQYPGSLSADAYFTVVPFQDALNWKYSAISGRSWLCPPDRLR
jgi:hypothetical protein